MKALITGASRGLGLALARALARDGWDLVIDGRDPAVLRAAADTLVADRAGQARDGAAGPEGPAGGAVTAIAGDVADPAHRAALARAAAGDVAGPPHRAAVARAADGLDLLVNNASTLGATPLPRLAGYPLHELERAFLVNTLGPLALIQQVLPALRARRGAIVNVSSDAAHEPYAGWGGYGATKAALEQLSNVLAAEEPDVAVWWFDPGEMRTGMLAAAGEDAAAAPLPEDAAVPALLELITARPPSGRRTAAQGS